VPDAGIDSPEAEVRWDAHDAANLGRAAVHGHQVVLLAYGACHLVHHPARSANDQVLHLLAQQRQLARLELQARRGRDRLFTKCIQ
jgi:hypothetical protein